MDTIVVVNSPIAGFPPLNTNVGRTSRYVNRVRAAAVRRPRAR